MEKSSLEATENKWRRRSTRATVRDVSTSNGVPNYQKKDHQANSLDVSNWPEF
jgi:hypothetical protein